MELRRRHCLGGVIRRRTKHFEGQGAYRVRSAAVGVHVRACRRPTQRATL